MTTLNNVVLFVLSFVLVLSVGSVGCTVDTDGGGSPVGPTTPTTHVDNPGAEPSWYDQAMYDQLVYNAYEADPVRDVSQVLESPYNYDIVFSRADPGGYCTITDDTVTLDLGGRHTLREIFNASFGRFDNPFWMISDYHLWTGRFYIEDNARRRRGRFVVRFTSEPGPKPTTLGQATLGSLEPWIKIFYGYGYDCALRSDNLNELAGILQHELGHNLGFSHTSPSSFPAALMHPSNNCAARAAAGATGHCGSPTLAEQHHMVWAYERGRGARRATGWPGGVPVGFSGLQRPAYPVRLPPIVIDD